MADSKNDVVANKLAALHLEFKNQLPNKISEIQELWHLLQNGQATNVDLASLHRVTHSLVGSGGTFGAVAVSEMARNWSKYSNHYCPTETYLHYLPPMYNRMLLNCLFSLLRRVIAGSLME